MEETTQQTAQELEREIEHDREELDRTLTQLQERLTMEHMIAEARHSFSSGIQTAAEMARRHPLPAAAVVLLAASAMVGRSRARSRQQAQLVGWLGLHEIARRAARSAGASAGVLQGMADKLPERVVYAGEEVARGTGEFLHAAQDGIQRGGHRLQEQVERLAVAQPGLLNALAMVVGGALMTALSRRH